MVCLSVYQSISISISYRRRRYCSVAIVHSVMFVLEIFSFPAKWYAFVAALLPHLQPIRIVTNNFGCFSIVSHQIQWTEKDFSRVPIMYFVFSFLVCFGVFSSQFPSYSLQSCWDFSSIKFFTSFFFHSTLSDRIGCAYFSFLFLHAQA